ncbi:MAG: rod shape-determining protein MreC [Acidimicrobiaceae bacterium]|nr:rod shape-determining protein MreC [Acidimicrobiaceae bacterium]
MLVLVSVTVLTLDYHGEANRAITRVRNGIGDGLSPVQRAVAYVLHPIGDAVAGAFRYGSVQAQNQALQNQIGRLNQSVAADDQASAEYKALIRLDGLPFFQNIHHLDAIVLSGPTSDFEYTIQIDRGTASGVAVGMPVVGGRGFVGTVVSAGSDQSTVRLLQDSRSAVGVRIGQSQTSGDVGVVSGQGRQSDLSVQLFASSGLVRKGEAAVTSGTSSSGVSAYPAGIPVATVSGVRSSSAGLDQTVSLTPVVDPSALQYVAVLLWTPPA